MHEGVKGGQAIRVALDVETPQPVEPPQGRRDGHQTRVADGSVAQAQALQLRQGQGVRVAPVACPALAVAALDGGGLVLGQVEQVGFLELRALARISAVKASSSSASATSAVSESATAPLSFGGTAKNGAVQKPGVHGAQSSRRARAASG